MKNILWVLMVLFAIVAHGQQKAYIISVYDGDTYYARIKGQVVRVRLANVDCPEVANKYTGKVAQDFANAAKDSVKTLILHKNVVIKTIGTDRYFRSVCQLWVGGRDLSNIVIKRGWGWVFFDYQKDKLREPILLNYQRVASKKRIGLWSLHNPVSPMDYRK